jgi:hypothetical protein
VYDPTLPPWRLVVSCLDHALADENDIFESYRTTSPVTFETKYR